MRKLWDRRQVHFENVALQMEPFCQSDKITSKVYLFKIDEIWHWSWPPVYFKSSEIGWAKTVPSQKVFFYFFDILEMSLNSVGCYILDQWKSRY